MVDLQRRAQQVEHLRFGRRAVAEVAAHRLGQQVLVALQLALQRLQPAAAFVGARVRAASGRPRAARQRAIAHARWRRRLRWPVAHVVHLVSCLSSRRDRRACGSCRFGAAQQRLFDGLHAFAPHDGVEAHHRGRGRHLHRRDQRLACVRLQVAVQRLLRGPFLRPASAPPRRRCRPAGCSPGSPARRAWVRAGPAAVPARHRAGPAR